MIIWVGMRLQVRVIWIAFKYNLSLEFKINFMLTFTSKSVIIELYQSERMNFYADN